MLIKKKSISVSIIISILIYFYGAVDAQIVPCVPSDKTVWCFGSDGIIKTNPTSKRLSLKIPSLTTTQRDASFTSPVDGLLIFNSTNIRLETSTSGVWDGIGGGGGGGGITSLGGLTTSAQLFTTGTSGTGFNISSSGSTHTFNLPVASAVNTGVVNTGAQTIAGAKTLSGASVLSGGATITCSGCVTDANVVDTLTISSGNINGTPVGATTPSTVAATALSSSGSNTFAALPSCSFGLVTGVGGLASCASNSGVVIGVQRFTVSGTYTPTAGMAYAIVYMVGAGGSGGGRVTTLVTQSTSSSGGAGGGVLTALLTAAQIGASQSITIGLGGAAAAIGGSGNPGGTTSVGALLSCTGGLGGLSSVVTGNTVLANGVSGGIPTVSTGTLIMSVNGQDSGFGSKNTISSGISYGGDSGGGSMFGHVAKGPPAISGTESASSVGHGSGTGSSGSSSHLFASAGAVSAAGSNGEVVIVEYR